MSEKASRTPFFYPRTNSELHFATYSARIPHDEVTILRRLYAKQEWVNLGDLAKYSSRHTIQQQIAASAQTYADHVHIWLNKEEGLLIGVTQDAAGAFDYTLLMRWHTGCGGYLSSDETFALNLNQKLFWGTYGNDIVNTLSLATALGLFVDVFVLRPSILAGWGYTVVGLYIAYGILRRSSDPELLLRQILTPRSWRTLSLASVIRWITSRTS